MYQPKVVLVVMDGWGYSTNKTGNAILHASLPNFDYLWNNYPHALLEAAGVAVGLPWGNIGSSEVGHACLGAGKVLHQDLPRISQAISSGEFFKNPVLAAALEYAKKHQSKLHFVGLVSAGGVHSHINHLFALFDLLKKKHFRLPSFIQMFTDGRDSPIKSAVLYLDKIEEKIRSLGLSTQIATCSGRYYAMDRDSRWQRTFACYDCLTLGKGEKAVSPKEALLRAYDRGLTDEFIPPTVIELQKPETSFFGKMFEHQKDSPNGLIEDNDAIIFFNFRPERARQLVETFLFPQMNYPGKKLRKNLFFTTLVEYDKSLPVKVVFPPEKIIEPLAKILSISGLSQLHIAETEKYAHATYFFDGGSPVPQKNEDWVTVPSPKVKTYDLRPEMSAAKITDKIFELANKKNYDFLLVNFANADMVGHTGNLQAAIRGVEAIDRELGRLTKNFPETVFLITSDHGNAESMFDPKTGEIETEHSLRPVPFILVGPQFQKRIPEENQTKPMGILADVAPTILDLLNIPAPPEMTGESLVKTIV